MAVRILAFAGSTRENSLNKKLARCAMAAAAGVGAETTFVDIRDLQLPLFDQDLEAREGPPKGATQLKQLLVTHDGLLIASPEYNTSLTAALKNAIDWASRLAKGEEPLAPFRGKVAGILSASPGAYGGVRGLVHLRAILGNLGVLVIPSQVAVPRAHQVFDASGRLVDDGLREKVEALAAEVVRVSEALAR